MGSVELDIPDFVALETTQNVHWRVTCETMTVTATITNAVTIGVQHRANDVVARATW